MLSLTMALSGSTSGGAATGGTSASRYSFFGTRMRWSIQSRSVGATNNYFMSKTFIGSPGYAITNPRFYMPAFVTGADSTGTETAMANDITIEGASIKIGGTWYACAGGTITAGQNGLLLPAITGVTIPADSYFEFRVAYQVPTNGTVPTQAKTTVLGSTLGDCCEGSTSTRSAKLTDGTAVVQATGHSDIYLPSYAVAQGGDGRPAFLGTGDSIMFAVTPAASWDARGNFGGFALGLDDAATSKRCGFFNSAISGNSPTRWKTRANIAKKLDAIKEVSTAYGEQPFDWLVDAHGHNATAATALADEKAWLTLARTEWGKPIMKIELFGDPDSTDGFATLGNQTAPTDWNYNAGTPASSGNKWLINVATSANGVSDPTADLRVNGYIDDSIAPWLTSAYDTGSNRDKHGLSAVASTIPAGMSAGSFTSIVVADGSLFNVGDNFVIPNGVVGGTASTGPGWGTVTAKSVNTLTVTAGANVPTGGAAVNAVIQVSLFDAPGTHPSPNSHVAYYKPAVITWKLALEARGWR